jgi:ParB family transcriptional regulator, chromosome partitioning protein
VRCLAPECSAGEPAGSELQPDQQEKALAECFREEWSGGGRKPRCNLLPVRHLQSWIERSILLTLKLAPFSKKDAQLVPTAGSCVDCPKRTGHNKLLFADIQQDACTDPTCYATKVEAHVQVALAAKPKLVQISTGYASQTERTAAIPRNKYVEIRPEKPDTPEKAKWPEYKTCRFTTEAIVTQGIEKGEIRKVCPNPDCPVHHPKKQPTKAGASFKAEQDKQRREVALANAIGLRTLSTIVAAVPVRLMKRDLLFLVESLLPLLDEPRLAMIARNRGIRAKDGEPVGKMLAGVLRKADESEIGRALVELSILLAVRSHPDGGKIISAAALTYKVDTDAIALKVRQEFAAKEKAKKGVAPAKVAIAKAKRAA